MADFYFPTFPNPNLALRNTKDEKGARLRTTPLSGTTPQAVIAITDRVLLGRIPANCRMVDIGQVNYGAFGGAAAFNIGFDHAKMTAGERTAAASKLWAAQSVVAAGSRKLMHAVALADLNKKAWQIAGLSADPGGELDIVMQPSAATANVAVIHAEATFTTD